MHQSGSSQSFEFEEPRSADDMCSAFGELHEYSSIDGGLVSVSDEHGLARHAHDHAHDHVSVPGDSQYNNNYNNASKSSSTPPCPAATSSVPTSTATNCTYSYINNSTPACAASGFTTNSPCTSNGNNAFEHNAFMFEPVPININDQEVAVESNKYGTKNSNIYACAMQNNSFHQHSNNCSFQHPPNASFQYPESTDFNNHHLHNQFNICNESNFNGGAYDDWWCNNVCMLRSAETACSNMRAYNSEPMMADSTEICMLRSAETACSNMHAYNSEPMMADSTESIRSFKSNSNCAMSRGSNNETFENPTSLNHVNVLSQSLNVHRSQRRSISCSMMASSAPTNPTYNVEHAPVSRHHHLLSSSSSAGRRLASTSRPSLRKLGKTRFRSFLSSKSMPHNHGPTRFIAAAATPSSSGSAINTSTTEPSQVLVDHTYMDFSSVADKLLDYDTAFAGESLTSILSTEGAKSSADVSVIHSKQNARAVKTFPNKLMEILSKQDTKEYIAWLPHGRSFKILDQEGFMSEIYPRFSKTTHYKSFQRQLNLWGFKRITKGSDRGAYYHQLFLRGMPNLAKRMILDKEKDKGRIRPSPNPSDEPDFYALAEKRPLPNFILDKSPLPKKLCYAEPPPYGAFL